MDEEQSNIENLGTSYKSSTNYELCIICQGEKIGEPLRVVQNVSSLTYAVECRQDLCAARLREALCSEKIFLQNKPKWHASCRQTFTSKRNLSFVKKKIEADGPTVSGVCTRSSVTPSFDFRSKCIICAEPEKPKKGPKFKMRIVETYERQNSFYKKSKLLQHIRPEVLLRIEGDGNSPIDMIAAEVHYHDSCMKKFMAILESSKPPDVYHEAFCDLIKEIDDKLTNGKVFLSSVLIDDYRRHLEIKGVDASKYRMSSLKTRMKQHYGEAIVFWSQRGCCDIVFKAAALNAGDLLKEYENLQKDLHENYIHLEDPSDSEEDNGTKSKKGERISTSYADNENIYMVSQKIKSDIEKIKSKKIAENNVSWEIAYEQANHLIPNSLYNLLAYILFDAEPIVDNEDRVNVQIKDHEKILNLAQDIVFAKNVITPKHVGLAVYVHHRTRSRDIITALSRFGHCVSYTNLQRILTTVAVKMQTKTAENEIYIPSNIVPGLFSHFAIDNLDFEENTRDGSSMHVTSMVLFQQSATSLVEGVSTGHVPVKIGRQQTLQEDKREYVGKELLGRGIKRKRRPETKCLDPEWLLRESVPEIQNLNLCWMLARLFPTKIIDHSPTASPDMLSYKSFCAQISACNVPVTAIGYLPFLPSSPTDPNVVANALKICIRTNKKLGNLFTVVSQDLAVYEISYALRREKPDEFPNLILRLGGFHLLMNFLGTVGKIMMGTGLPQIFVKAKVLLEGTANKVMAGKGFYQAMNAHFELYEGMLALWWQAFEDWALKEKKDVTIVSEIGHLLEEVRQTLKDDGERSRSIVKVIDDKLIKLRPLMDEYNSSRAEYPTHKLWLMYLELIGIAIEFMHAERNASWSDHLSATSRMLPYIISAGHHKYGVCIINYLEEMRKLPEVAPGIEDLFNSGLFTVKRAVGKFNCIWTDQALECSQNCDAKGRSGMAGLKGITMNEAAQEKWFLTLPFTTAVSSAIKFMLHMDFSDTGHHEDSPATTRRLIESRDRIMEVIKSGINPFTTTTKDLVNIMTGQITSKEVEDSLLCAKELGMQELCSYLSGDHPTLKVIKLKSFITVQDKKRKNPMSKTKDNLYNEIAMLKKILLMKEQETDSSSGHFQSLLSHEILPYPPALAEIDDETCGFRLRGGNKASILEYMKTKLHVVSWPEEIIESNQNLDTSYIIDLMGFIRTKMPKHEEISKSFAERILFDIIYNRPAKCRDIHIVADRYDGLYGYADSCGDNVCLKDASGCHTRRMTSSTVHHIEKHMPIENWKGILCNATSKTNLIQLLFDVWEASSHLLPEGVTLNLAGGFSNRLKSVSVNSKCGVQLLKSASSTQEEGDTRVILHTKLAVQNKCKRVVIRANDTDIVTLALYFFKKFTTEGLKELWIQFHDYCIPVHKIAEVLDKKEITVLPFVHALSGCDTTSYIYMKGKKTFLNSMTNSKTIDQLLCVCEQLENVSEVTEDLFQQILNASRNLVCAVYGKQNADYEDLNKLRTNLYVKKKDLRGLPPTEDAFALHVKRAILQTFIWITADQPQPAILDPFKFGWVKKETVKPLLTTIAPVPKQYAKSAYCTCKGRCGYKCPCRNHGICALMCNCGGTEGNCLNISVSHFEIENDEF